MNVFECLSNRASPLYVGKLPLEEVAGVLARACGHWGTGAEYLLIRYPTWKLKVFTTETSGSFSILSLR